MSLILPWIAQILHLALMLVVAPVAAGITDWLRARLSGRAGPPWRQAWRDLVRLYRKQRTMIESASAVSRWAPVVALGATFCASALVPSFSLGMGLAPVADVVVIVSLLSMERIATALLALDAGSARPGLAAGQASAMAVLAEPAIILAMFTMGVMGGSFNLDAIMLQQREEMLLPAMVSALAAAALLILLFAEACLGRSAIEDVAGGRDLALARYSAWLRRIVWIDLIGGLFLPIGVAGPDAGVAAWLTGMTVWAVKLGVFVAGLAAMLVFIGPASRRTPADVAAVAAVLALLATAMVLTSVVAA